MSEAGVDTAAGESAGLARVGPRPPTLAPGERWYCVHTQPRREAFARENLERQGFRCFLPLLRRTVRHARRVETRLSALFPRYAFLVLDLGRDRWRSVNGTLGVVRLLMEGERPRAVPEGVVETLAASADASGAVRFDRELRPGDRVRILAGPFAERIATVTRLDEKGRVALLLEILGAERPVVTARGDLLPLP